MPRRRPPLVKANSCLRWSILGPDQGAAVRFAPTLRLLQRTCVSPDLVEARPIFVEADSEDQDRKAPARQKTQRRQVGCPLELADLSDARSRARPINRGPKGVLPLDRRRSRASLLR